jgi:O-acetyl-ADP-ribose deacetylase (regulator of RNase III)
MPFNIVRDDITKMRVDAVVCDAAGADMAKVGGGFVAVKPGEAVFAPGYELSAKNIIHTVGPMFGEKGDEAKLCSCYTNSLRLAVANGCESVAFPLISGGADGCPKETVLSCAISAIRDFILENDVDINVTLVVTHNESLAVSEGLLGRVRSYIGNYYEEPRNMVGPPLTAHGANLTDTIRNLDESFSTTLLRLIDASGKKDSEIYRRANIDCKHFSKIRSNADYSPSKPTVLAFAVALRLDLRDTTELLRKAGFAFSRSRMFDVIVEFFIVNGHYDIFEINEVLFEHDQKLLGA